jgi:high-affinity nickel-transport protein
MNSVLTFAFALGLRHGVDPDHLTAIDGLSRIRPRATNGLYFALGHGLVVTALAAGVGGVLAGRAAFLAPWALLLIGMVNLWRIIVPFHELPSREGKAPILAEPLLLGMLLAAGFETSSQLSVLVLAGDSSAWLAGVAFSAGMVVVDGLDGYLAASVQSLAGAGAANAQIASRWLGLLVVVFSFALGGAELTGVDVDKAALPLGFVIFAAVIVFRFWARRSALVSIAASVADLIAVPLPSATTRKANSPT